MPAMEMGLLDIPVGVTAAFLVTAAALVLWYILAEQLSYRRKKGPLHGPPLVLPFLGSAVPWICHPPRFWQGLACRARESGMGLAVDYMFGRIIVFIRDTELSRRVFANIRPDAFQLITHPFGIKIFGEHNIMYMFGDDHKDLRRRVSAFFAPRALAANVVVQQRLILAHLRRWVQQQQQQQSQSGGAAAAIPLESPCRELNLEVSQTLFVGPYLDEEARERMRRDYCLFNVGVMAMPVDLPGFAFRRAKEASARLLRTLGECARASKARMRAGKEPECLVDFWMQQTVREMDEAAAAGQPRPAHSGDDEIRCFLLDILFAAQDASTSSLCWAVSLLGSHPDVLARVRAEVAALWSPESGEPITAEQLREMRYTQSVALEVVRSRPPASILPHVAVQPFQLTEWYTVPKGALVFPSLYESSLQGFTDAEAFDPERFFSEARREDVVHKRNLLAFGAGPHQCVGQRYALNHLVLFIALFVSMVDFRRDTTEGRDDIVFIPSTMPKDRCAVYLKQRCTTFPSL